MLEKKTKSDEQYRAEWLEKYGEKGLAIIEKSVDKNVADYEYLKQFAIKGGKSIMPVSQRC